MLFVKCSPTEPSSPFGTFFFLIPYTLSRMLCPPVQSPSWSSLLEFLALACLMWGPDVDAKDLKPT